MFSTKGNSFSMMDETINLIISTIVELCEWNKIFRSNFITENYIQQQKSFTLEGLKDSIKFVVMLRGGVWTGY